MSDRKKIVLALAGSILFHVIIILLLWGVNEIWPAIPDKASANEGPTQLTMLDSPPPQENQRQYVRTNDDQKTDQKPDNPAFESDKDTAAASELAPKADAPLPTQEGKQQPDLGFKNEGESLAANGQTFARIPGKEEAVPQAPAPKQQQEQPKEESTPPPELTPTPETSPTPEPSPAATPTPESTPTPTPEAVPVPTPSAEATSTPQEETTPPPTEQATSNAVAEATPSATPIAEAAPTPLFTPVAEASSTPLATPVAQASPLESPVAQATPTPELTPNVEATPAPSPVASPSQRSTPVATPKPEPTVTELALLRPPSTPFAAPTPFATPAPAPTVAIRPRRTPVPHPTTAKNSTLVKKGAPPTAYRPQQRLTSLQGNISNRGRSAVAALGTPQGRFEKAVEDAVGSRWYYYVQERVDLVSVGTVQVRFNVQRDGRVEEARIVGNSSNQTLASCSLQSVIDATIPPMPEEMAPLVPPSGVEFTFSFTFD